jgi:F-type H+-transporting ATPase subunit epsilon
MSQTDLQIKILSPDRIFFRGAAKSLGLPGELGYMTLLPGHASMVASLDAGILAMDIDGQSGQRLFLSGGFVDVTESGVTVLADVIEKSSEINVERAKKALARADGRLSSKSPGTLTEVLDVPRALRAKKRAELRLELAGATKQLH